MTGKVMIIDDDREFGRELKEALEFYGNEVAVVGDPGTALEEIAAFRPGVIIVDLRMPGKDGFEIVRAVRKNPDFGDIPVIAITAYLSEYYLEQLNRYGLSRYHTKPVDIMYIVADVSNALWESAESKAVTR